MSTKSSTVSDIATSGANGIFSRRLDFSSFNVLPRQRINSYSIKLTGSDFGTKYVQPQRPLPADVFNHFAAYYPLSSPRGLLAEADVILAFSSLGGLSVVGFHLLEEILLTVVFATVDEFFRLNRADTLRPYQTTPSRGGVKLMKQVGVGGGGHLCSKGGTPKDTAVVALVHRQAEIQPRRLHALLNVSQSRDTRREVQSSTNQSSLAILRKGGVENRATEVGENTNEKGGATARSDIR
uniref:Headcase domain-containing protein n=1 Tax=Anopheles atroparvus TaxID=41427 RepID=A0A182J904_ANOAO